MRACKWIKNNAKNIAENFNTITIEIKTIECLLIKKGVFTQDELEKTREKVENTYGLLL